MDCKDHLQLLLKWMHTVVWKFQLASVSIVSKNIEYERKFYDLLQLVCCTPMWLLHEQRYQGCPSNTAQHLLAKGKTVYMCYLSSVEDTLACMFPCTFAVCIGWWLWYPKSNWTKLTHHIQCTQCGMQALQNALAQMVNVSAMMGCNFWWLFEAMMTCLNLQYLKSYGTA